uniref:PiggyBac transposable element-derived protein domain-containing protein n=1 Tax=Globisporangium ultimum (strain ATCC 200006 / CBS 805.95 / DAOM BR144) TaxID=431595 RepID=K3WSK2_GLOUD
MCPELSQDFPERNIEVIDATRLKRFQQLRKAFCFCNLSSEELKQDAELRIRSLPNLRKYVQVGGEFSVDEAGVACRSKFGRHLILYNKTKLGGDIAFVST